MAEQVAMPFHWRFQPCEDEKYWCKCQRCRKCLKGLSLHVLARSQVGDVQWFYAEERVSD